ncbi:MAG: hypothetical protein FD155_3444 [Bacteroidetes bacterium]|nr:MAG: hypothetical protein FD155_3444 [Bacteroidota bacterium]
MRDWTFEYHRTFNGAGAVGEKHVFGSEGTIAGMGCQNLAFVRWGVCFLSFQSCCGLSSENGFSSLVPNDCIYAIWRLFRKHLQPHHFLYNSYQAA